MFLQVSPALGDLGGSSPKSLTLTEREHFWGGLLEWPSSWPCSPRNPVTWSKKEVTSNWCHSTSFWPREQKVASSRISAQRCSLVVKHTNPLQQESLFEELQLPTGYHLIIMELPPSAPLKRDKHGYRHSLFSFFLSMGLYAQNGEFGLPINKHQTTQFMKKHFSTLT